MTKARVPHLWVLALASGASSLGLLGASCVGEIRGEDPPPDAGASSTTAPISRIACLRKLAMDLTNVAPSDEDFAALAAGKSLNEFVDQYMATPAFSKIIFNVFRTAFAPTELVPDDADKEEPARIARHLVVSNGDFRDIVIGSYTVDPNDRVVPAANAAGVLTTRSYLSAYTGAEFRNWSGQVLKGLAGIVLIPVTEIPADIDASPAGLAANPACAGCHTNPVSGVDNVASFHECYDNDGLPVAKCTPSGTKSFLGQQGATISDLGRILADSVEWRAKAIQDFHRIFWGRGIGKNETSFYHREEAAWIEADYQPQALIKSIVLSPEYCSR